MPCTTDMTPVFMTTQICNKEANLDFHGGGLSWDQTTEGECLYNESKALQGSHPFSLTTFQNFSMTSSTRNDISMSLHNLEVHTIVYFTLQVGPNY